MLTPSQLPPVPRRTINLFLFRQINCSNKGMSRAFETVLTEAERQQSKRFRFQSDQNTYVLSRILLRTVLAGYLHQEPDQLELTTERFGKPALANRKEIAFNLSHSSGATILSVAANSCQSKAIGVDIENMAIERPIQSLAKSSFSDSETAFLLKHSHLESRKAHFYRLWTLKEAFVKADGRGFSLDMKSFSIGYNKNEIWLEREPIVIPDDYHACFFQRCLYDHYMIACSQISQDNEIAQFNLYELKLNSEFPYLTLNLMRATRTNRSTAQRNLA